MHRQNILFWVSIAGSVLFGAVVTGIGVYLFLSGQNCRSYNDYACAFSAMFSFIVVPFGLAIFLFVGLVSLPFKSTRLIGATVSVLLGVFTIVLCCLMTLGAVSTAGEGFLSQEMGNFLLLPLGMFLGGFALVSVGIIGYLRSK